MTLTTPKRFLALGLATAFAVAACGGGGSSAQPSTGATGGGTTAPSDGGAAPTDGASAPAESQAAGGGVPDCLSFADIYALVGPESTGFANWSEAQTIASELGSTTTFPDLPLSVTAPGEESGTFDSFVELAIADAAEARTQDETTRPDYTASANDNAIIEGVAGSEGSFGWVGFAFYEENSQQVRALQVSEEAGGACVEPTAETISSNEYPLSRDLYIYVNKAKATENPAVAAYVDYYVAEGTISTALETVPYVNLAPEALAETQAAWTGAGITGADANGTVFVTGSSTVEPISNSVAEAFKAANAGFDYTVEGPGTGDGFAKFCAGEADIADASRPIREEEAQTCAGAGIEYVELKVAIDGIAVITQP